MKVISLSGRFNLRLKKTCAAIGIFDGVHRGHQYLIRQMIFKARRLHAKPIVITFFPHPAHVLRPELKLGYLISLKERLRLLAQLGVATCLVVRFNRRFANTQPQKFIQDILVQQLGVKAVFVGDQFCFGKNRSGDVALFQRLASAYGFEIHALPGLKQGGKIISSMRIRNLIAEGKLDEASRLLGRPVVVSGEVIEGARRGRSLGYPTANVDYGQIILPPLGVYVVQVMLNKKEYPAMANIGTRPSFDQKIERLHLEVHILDFSRNIYGKPIEVQFLKKIRNEKKFPNPQALIQQIQKDEVSARKYFNIFR